MTTEERLQKVERELERTKHLARFLVGIISLCFGTGAFFWASDTVSSKGQASGEPVKEIRASRFVLEDENGNMRAALGINNSQPTFVMTDEDGIDRIGLVVTKDGSGGLVLKDKNRNARAGLFNVNKFGPSLMLNNESGEPCVSIEASPKGSAVRLTDVNAKQRLTLQVVEMRPAVSLLDTNGKLRILLGVNSDEPLIQMLDKNENPIPLR